MSPRRSAYGRTLRFAVVAARFNPEITRVLVSHCLAELLRRGVPRSRADVLWVPGGYEIPWAAQELAMTRRYDAVICIGAILRGQTPQNGHIAASVLHHLHAVSLATRVPCVAGIITPNTYAQARARTRGALDRGKEAALAALELAGLRRSMKRG